MDLMKWMSILLIIIGSLALPGGPEVMALSEPNIYLSSDTMPQGNLTLIKIPAKKGETPQVTWMKREIYLARDSQKTSWYGFLAADLRAKPGRYKVLVKILPAGLKKQFEIKVIKKDYGVRRLTLPQNMVDLDAKTLKRAKKESKTMKSLWNAIPSAPFWRGPFLRPVPGEVKGPFGRRSVINNQPRSPHSGVDLKAGPETPIMAINNGRVVLTAEHFFTGHTVVIDHGGEIQSMYFHLHGILVEQGEIVTKGKVIGLVGSTGRSTGPHLHWGIRVNGARVDPLSLTALSRQLEE